jgi:hypothetical protein
MSKRKIVINKNRSRRKIGDFTSCSFTRRSLISNVRPKYKRLELPHFYKQAYSHSKWKVKNDRYK